MRLPYDRTGLMDHKPVLAFLKRHKPSRIFLEKVQGRDGWGATQIFSLGQSYGMLRIVLANSGFGHQLVGPKTWQSAAHEGIDTKLKPKEKSVVAYNNLFGTPPIKVRRGSKPHDGAVDCILMAVWAFQKYKVIPGKWRVEEWKHGT